MGQMGETHKVMIKSLQLNNNARPYFAFKAKNPNKHKSKKISSKKKSDTAASPNLYAEYNKVAGQPMGKKERKVLQDTSSGFKPYPKTSELTKKSNLSRTFNFYKFHFCSLLFLYFQRKKLLAGKVINVVFLSAPCP